MIRLRHLLPEVIAAAKERVAAYADSEAYRDRHTLTVHSPDECTYCHAAIREHAPVPHPPPTGFKGPEEASPL